ncbi:DUF2846 domain-containing protein [Herbaspirillum robiniae]|uniref:DUF2846 domain-containing protein n=1 Tax=Herbaspirillum robiniae TaxID=2014887 RepID=A0ABX2LX31_9BURK|nr:DUF2846 domain-containing protein [Herbaspirillum robiniae]NUU03050.1 DUF2846 domain-containing protein [Herbaspirillum robiniae]
MRTAWSRFARAAIICIVILLSGCATAPGESYQGLAQLQAGFGDVYLYRTPGLYAIGQSFDVQVDGQKRANLYNASYVVLRLRPGVYDLAVYPGGMSQTSHASVKVEAGRRRFYQYDFPGGLLGNMFFIGAAVEIRQQQQAEADMAGLKLAQDRLPGPLGEGIAPIAAEKGASTLVKSAEERTSAAPTGRANGTKEENLPPIPASPLVFAGNTVPVFSQLVRANYPAGFKSILNDAGPSRYLQEFVPEHESAGHWSQMMTLSGIKDLAANPEYSTQRVAEEIQSQFKDACPFSYSGKTLSQAETNGVEMDVSVFGCGRHTTKAGIVSETTLLVVLKGQRDYYTLQWAERGAPLAKPIPLDLAKWIRRYRDLGPVRLCARIEGEQSPYPSCS